MDELEKALLDLIKGQLGVVKRSKKDPFAEITVQGKRPGKPAIYKALRSLEREGLVRIIKHNWDTTYLPAARTLRNEDDVRNVVSRHLRELEIDMKILAAHADEAAAKSLKDLDDVLAEFLKTARKTLRQEE